MKIGERNAQIASSNIHSGYESVLSAKAPRSRLLIGRGAPAKKFCASLSFHRSCGILA
ncbi:MAG: hypothetical protein ACLQBK_06615 [Candidatus Sulfotelmatobacter sp.]